MELVNKTFLGKKESLYSLCLMFSLVLGVFVGTTELEDLK
jgi:hypothetical protein